MKNNFKDITGKRFGKLIAVSYIGNLKWMCHCDCGNDKIINGGSLRHNHTKSCGCLYINSGKHLNRAYIPLQIGQRFGRLVVISNNKCQCDCGNIKIVNIPDLKRGKIKSCGCYQKECRKRVSINSISKTELLLGDYIENEYHIKIDRSFSVEDRLYDIRYKNILIESDGKYWHSTPKAIKNDTYKNNIAERNGYTLIRFSLDSEAQVKEEWVSLIKPILDKYFT